MHLCVSKLSSIASPGRWQVIIWNNAVIFVNWTLKNKIQWNFARNSNIFIDENTCENVVCEMSAILSRPRCVKAEEPPAKSWYLRGYKCFGN